jgi:predicted nicotinamide N-methyase
MRSIADFDAVCTTADVGADRLAFWTVADLERHVDRDAILRGDDPPEPPYWAHCWSGARVLAERVPWRAGRVVELGCGLGLPGLVAARRGARVTFVDRLSTPLAFVRASLASNAMGPHRLVVADLLRPAWRASFDLVLAAEVLYDSTVFAPMVAAMRAMLAPHGRILLADGHRIDTAAFYEIAARGGLSVVREEIRVVEEGFPATVSIVTMRRAAA